MATILSRTENTVSPKLRYVAQNMLVALLVLAISLPSAWAQEQWYAECPDCAAHGAHGGGGSGVAGPYPSREVCEQYVQRMRDQGFAFGDCHPGNGSGTTSSESSGGFSARAIHKHWFFFGVIGGVLGGAGAYALSPTLDQPQLGNNAARGAAVGFVSFTVLALLIGHDHSAKTSQSAAPKPSQPSGGEPIFDCRGAQARYDRLSAGLPVQREAIRRAEELFGALQEERRSGTEEARKKNRKYADDQVVEASKEILEEEAKLEALKAAKARAGTIRADLLDQIDREVKAIDAISRGLQSFQAGIAYGEDIQKSAHTLSEHLIMLNRLLTDSGIYEEAGGKALGVFLGPAGPLAFKGLLFLVDASVGNLQAADLQQQIQQAADNLNGMRFQYGRVQEKLADLKANCLH